MVESFKDKLIEVLINGKLIKQKDLDAALQQQKKSGGSLGKILVDSGAISPKTLMVILSQQLNIPLIDLTKYKVNKEIAKLIPEKVARQYSIIPISKIGKVLTVAMVDPLNVFAIDDVKLITNFKIEPVLATENDLQEAFSTCYGAQIQGVAEMFEEAEVAPSDIEVLEDEERVDISEIAETLQSAPIVKVVSLILNEALKKRASDIHVEPTERALKIRYRIDGSLHEVLTIPEKNQNAVIARLKIMSKLDITETRVPQDGRFRISFEGKQIDFRVSVLPLTFGGKIVLRVLDKSNLNIGLDRLGFLPQPLNTFKTALAKPFGMILLTGPTGSGKSTTLYSIVNQLNTPERNIVTLEDPVEYELEGITQIPMSSEIGLTFATGLKSVLRQSPDIIMVGEIRDYETADIAIKATLTGQLILSTLHTNDAAGAITRLIDMGVEPFLVGTSVVMVAAQRLMRKICPACKEEVDIPDGALLKAGIDPAKHKGKGVKFYHGKGCSKCNQSGHYGRMAILEALLVDDNIRDMITRRASSDEIKEYGMKHGMLTLRDNAVENFVRGNTTFEEVLNVTTED
jgi:type IV pilus assembly protein PilB